MFDISLLKDAIELVKDSVIDKCEVNNVKIYRVKDIIRIDIKVDKENKE